MQLASRCNECYTLGGAIPPTPYALLLCSGIQAHVHDVPDHERTPGALNGKRHAGQSRQDGVRCGWTHSIRSRKSYIRKLRLEQMRELGQLDKPADYHEDRIVPLYAGGHPSDPKNLWPQPLRGQWNDSDKN